jgi:hypothetical protein
MDLARRQSIELLEAHNERSPLVGVDPVGMSFQQKRCFDVHAANANLADTNPTSLARIALRQPV